MIGNMSSVRSPKGGLEQSSARRPRLFNLRLDPFERCWFNNCPPEMMEVYGHEFWRFVYVQQEVAAMGETFVQFPPMQKPASFNLENVRDQILSAIGAAHGGKIYGGVGD